MNARCELIKKIINEHKYKIVEEDEDFIIIRYQMNTIHITSSEDDNFVTILLPRFTDVTEDNYVDVLMRCNKLNENMKQAKVYIMDDIIIATAEFYYMNESDLSFQISTGLNSVIAAKVNYRKLEKQ